MIWPLSLLVGVLVALIITAATAYFVAQEFAYMSVDRSRLRAAAAAGDAGARRALSVTSRTSFMLSGAQLGITVTGLLVGYVAEPLIGEAVGTALGGISVPAAVGITVGTLLALTFSTFVQMLIGELFPKNLAIARPEPIAVALARSTGIYLTVFGWLIAVFDKSSNLLLRLLRIEPVHDVEHSATLRDLAHIVAASRESGDLPRDLSILLDRVIDFPNRTVEHAMIPRARVGVLRPDVDLDRVRQMMSTGHSRYPVIDDADEVVGVVHLQDVLGLVEPEDQVERGRSRTAADLMRPALFVPTVLGLPRALAELTNSGNQLACVLDEYGGFVGVLTAEDLAEELVGEIADEHDPAGPLVLAADPSPAGWRLPGDLPVDEVQRLIGRDLPTGDYETMAGLAIARCGGFPRVGYEVEVPLPPDPRALAMDEHPPPEVVRLRVDEVTRHVPSRITLTVTRPSVPAPSSAPAREVR